MGETRLVPLSEVEGYVEPVVPPVEVVEVVNAVSVTPKFPGGDIDANRRITVPWGFTEDEGEVKETVYDRSDPEVNQEVKRVGRPKR